MTLRRRLRPEEQRLWAVVARTVTAAPGRTLEEPAPEPALPATATIETTARPHPAPALFTRRSPRTLGEPPPPAKAAAPGAHAAKPRRPPAEPPAPEGIEPNRKRRIVRAPEVIAARLDLHGLDQDRARSALHGFIRAAAANDARAVLVITGKGRTGDGVLRQRTPDWLNDPAVRPLIAGVSPADRRHGGDGALYVALKRRT